MTKSFDNYIHGTWTTGVDQRPNINPSDTSDVIGLYASASAEQAEDAIRSARDAFAGWSRGGVQARHDGLQFIANELKKRREEIGDLLAREEGKTRAEGIGEAARAAQIFDFFAGEVIRQRGEKIPSVRLGIGVEITREPLGVVAAITPWNFPIAIPAWKIAPALAYGNCVVFKPADLAPGCAWALAEIISRAGLPDGVFNLVMGPGSRIGQVVLDHPEVDAVTFTGSVGVGGRVAASCAARRAKFQLEMGGKNPLVVLDDAEPAAAARIAAVGGWGLTGQACTATSRVIATPGAVRPFVDAMRAEAERYRPGNGLQDGVLMGPVVSESQLATDLSYVDIARQDGGEVVLGGDADGLRFSPTLVGSVRPDDRIAVEEVFGPVISVIEASDFDEAVAVANDVPYGLCAGICTRDLASAHAFAERVRAGVVKVNRPTTGLDLNVPFGGIKASSTGTFREQGASAVDFFTWSKSVYLGFDG
jgi:aldehyde dehydrogenase (NAD+)